MHNTTREDIFLINCDDFYGSDSKRLEHLLNKLVAVDSETLDSKILYTLYGSQSRQEYNYCHNNTKFVLLNNFVHFHSIIRRFIPIYVNYWCSTYLIQTQSHLFRMKLYIHEEYLFE